MSKKNYAAVIFAAAFFMSIFSCTSAGQFPINVPNESKINNKNIAIEYYSIAQAYFDLKKYDKAAQYYKLSMRQKDLYASSYYQLGRSYALSSNWAEAEKIFSDILEKDPENVSLQQSMAYIIAMKGDVQTSLSMYKTLCDNYPDNSELLTNYIALLINSEDFETAEEKLLVLKNKFPDNTLIDSLQKKIYEKLNKNEKIDENS